jgi:hypothetical protein
MNISTDNLHTQILLNVEIQKRNHPDSDLATAAREANRPLLAEMARREKSGETVPMVM